MGEVSNAAVVLLGVGTVFVGLVGLVLCCRIMGYIITRTENRSAAGAGNASGAAAGASRGTAGAAPAASATVTAGTAPVSEAAAAGTAMGVVTESMATEAANRGLAGTADAGDGAWDAAIQPAGEAQFYANGVQEETGLGMELAVSAALAEMNNVDISDIRIRSIRRIDGSDDDIPNRQQLIAAISVAIAEMLGTDAAGIRVHSFRRV